MGTCRRDRPARHRSARSRIVRYSRTKTHFAGKSGTKSFGPGRDGRTIVFTKAQRLRRREVNARGARGKSSDKLDKMARDATQSTHDPNFVIITGLSGSGMSSA